MNKITICVSKYSVKCRDFVPLREFDAFVIKATPKRFHVQGHIFDRKTGVEVVPRRLRGPVIWFRYALKGTTDPSAETLKEGQQ